MLLLAFLAAQSATPAPPAPPAPPIDWAVAARSDVEAGYALLRDNHPGWVDPDNPGFRSQLGTARDAGLGAAAKAKGAEGYAEALAAFSAVLADGHAGLRLEKRDEQKTRWPGFLTAWRGDRLLVTDGEPAPGFGRGSEIMACDGVPIAELIVRRLRPRGARLNEAGRWWSDGGKVLTDGAATAGPAPSACTVRLAGREAEARLEWREAPADFTRRFLEASNGGYSDIGLTEPRPGLFVVGMPTFAVGDDGVKMYQALTDSIARRHGELARARAIVLDLRFNQGGSSAWSRKVASALWGEPAVATRLEAYHQPVEVWWRNSPANIDYLRGVVGELARQGQPDTAREIEALAGRMALAHAKSEDFTVEEPASSGPPPAPARARLDVPVYVITPGQCASACLDALDAFRLFPNVRLIGAPTSADSQYMDVRRQPLPSGMGFAIIPLKIWTKRPRKGGQVYWPDIAMKQLDWSTAAFLDAIEAELSKRAPRR